MWQQLINYAGPLGWQPLQHITQIGVRITAVELGRLDQVMTAPARQPAMVAAQLESENATFGAKAQCVAMDASSAFLAFVGALARSNLCHNFDLADHPRLVVTGNQTSEVEFAGTVEVPDQLSLFSR